MSVFHYYYIDNQQFSSPSSYKLWNICYFKCWISLVIADPFVIYMFGCLFICLLLRWRTNVQNVSISSITFIKCTQSFSTVYLSLFDKSETVFPFFHYWQRMRGRLPYLMLWPKHGMLREHKRSIGNHNVQWSGLQCLKCSFNIPCVLKIKHLFFICFVKEQWVKRWKINLKISSPYGTFIQSDQ